MIEQAVILSAVKERADFILRLANKVIVPKVKEEREKFTLASVNWSHFGCVDVEYVISATGKESFFRAIFEEAAPENKELHKRIAELLPAVGIDEFVEVVTEW